MPGRPRTLTAPPTRLTISIPAALGERVERYRHRLNLSGVCQQAIEEAIEALEQRDHPKPTSPWH